MEKEVKTISEILEEVKTQICDDYCRYPREIEDYDELLDGICSSCPFERL